MPIFPECRRELLTSSPARMPETSTPLGGGIEPPPSRFGGFLLLVAWLHRPLHRRSGRVPPLCWANRVDPRGPCRTPRASGRGIGGRPCARVHTVMSPHAQGTHHTPVGTRRRCPRNPAWGIQRRIDSPLAQHDPLQRPAKTPETLGEAGVDEQKPDRRGDEPSAQPSLS